ncbi:hypothetical protein C5E10_11220 [Pseudoclavibacter sp. RFBG4]|uniref:hypothetical protein n=1 Tax=Pseudoclavibacter sp. RFBG4 TaxID=2080575 RepID=UPI000CE8556F|nr:hypothetical protein [Pseudoclavibacter sp. RFBG4]PPG31519.1 hypothetical protein C5E10_11220 [Pseudoclavibacter sp. RFBG4]
MSSEASERWLALSQQFPVGPKRRSGTLRSAEATDAVAVGQLRQAYWGGANLVVVVDAIDDAAALVSVLPATLEPGVENRKAVVIEDDASPLHGAVTVWPAHQGLIPFATLGATIATIPKPQLQAIEAARSSDTILDGLRRGHAEPALESGAALALADLFDAFDVLQSAPRLQPTVSDRAGVRLQVPLETIMSAIGTSQPRAMAIRMGKELLTVEEVTRLAASVEVPVGEVLDAIDPLPTDLQRELQEPRWRARIRDRATDGDENDARTRLGYEAYQLAARETGQGRELWRQRLDTVLATDKR